MRPEYMAELAKIYEPQKWPTSRCSPARLYRLILIEKLVMQSPRLALQRKQLTNSA